MYGGQRLLGYAKNDHHDEGGQAYVSRGLDCDTLVAILDGDVVHVTRQRER